MDRLEELLRTLEAMDDNPGWLSGDKQVVAQLCRCVSEIGQVLRLQARRNESILRNQRAGGIISQAGSNDNEF